MTTAIAPNWLKPLAWAALIWNLLGVTAFIIQLMMTPETLSKLPLDQQASYSNIPYWATLAFAIAVFSGTLACLLLIYKNKLASVLCTLSLCGILVQQYYNFIVIDSINLLGISAITMPLLVIIIAICLLALSIKGNRLGWLK
ncbi:hypothetical protein J8L70_14220 [Pseudoalteromonas sp. MMG010]|uniref:hypothetical protein n=1 Tax=Pseudoalteromonas sp. MMG010 TaxID=2822685 RepID=UPI001B3A37C9|nr:hypothetical protein [Pseudoalteromonas sp. MMG010]MBQ4834405.1 hypothetical protein [Pseudoalteromonas sp. MMG010]